jgi:hypothetical protein
MPPEITTAPATLKGTPAARINTAIDHSVLTRTPGALGTPPFRAQDEHNGRKHRFRHISLLHDHAPSTLDSLSKIGAVPVRKR